MVAVEAEFIWSDETGEGLNRYVLFRRSFALAGQPQSGEFHLFADTRYRLIVNGAVVGHGPGRFFRHKPEYDTWDIAPFLSDGPNVVAVMVNSYGCYTYHSQYSHGGLIGWGQVEDDAGGSVDLATGDGWKALDSPGHCPETAHLSFVLNPGELLDARHMPEDWAGAEYDDSDWPQAVALADQGFWSDPVPRTIPLLDEREVLPRERNATWVARPADAEDVYSFIVVGEDGTRWREAAPSLAITYVHSPAERQVTFGGWEGRYWVNGQEVEGTRRDDIYMRKDFTVTLREGWNALQILGTLNVGAWECYLGLPRDAGLSVSAEKEIGSPNMFMLAGPWEGDRQERATELTLPLASPDDLPADLGPWRMWPRERGANSAFCERAWKKLTALPADSCWQVDGADYAAQVGPDSLILTFDFGGEVLGRPVLDMTAAAGTLVDVMYSERLPDGVPEHYHRLTVRMAERYITRAGRQTWQTFHPRGFRWLDVVVTGDLSGFSLHRVSATRANYPVEWLGRFACSDPRLNAIWQMGADTQHACMEDAYLDCPRRERGSYPGDNLAQFHTVLAVFGDTQLMRHTVELALLSQDENGMMPHCSHSPLYGQHPDYTAITVQSLWVYYARTGDVDFLREMKPRLERTMAGLASFEVPQYGLLDGSHLQPYLDIGRLDRTGMSCALNCFYQRAFHDAARIMRVIGDDGAAARYQARAESLAQAIRTHYWDEERGVFLDRLRSEVPDTQPSAPGNILPLLYEIADEDQAPRALEFVVEAMLHNFQSPVPTRYDGWNVSAYFSFYGLGVLYGYGLAEEAEQYIRTCWGIMLDRGAWTCWENWVGLSSQCHAWASSPTHYMSSAVLGVTFPEPGNPNRVRIAPQPGSLSWAEGVYPHPAGPIRVSWQVRAGRLTLEYEAPECVDVETAREA